MTSISDIYEHLKKTLGEDAAVEYVDKLKQQDNSENLKELDTLDSIVHALQKAIVDAQAEIKDHQLEQFNERFFNSDGSCKMVNFQLPDSNGNLQKTEIPLLTLVNHDSIAIDEVDVDFEVQIDAHNSDEKKGKIWSSLAKSNKKAGAKVHLKFKHGAPSEGFMRINDKLIKLISN